MGSRPSLLIKTTKYCRKAVGKCLRYLGTLPQLVKGLRYLWKSQYRNWILRRGGLSLSLSFPPPEGFGWFVEVLVALREMCSLVEGGR